MTREKLSAWICGVGVGASRMSPRTRPVAQVHVNAPESAPVGRTGADVSQAPTWALSAARSRAQWSASLSISKFIASRSFVTVTDPETNTRTAPA